MVLVANTILSNATWLACNYFVICLEVLRWPQQISVTMARVCAQIWNWKHQNVKQESYPLTTTFTNTIKKPLYSNTLSHLRQIRENQTPIGILQPQISYCKCFILKQYNTYNQARIAYLVQWLSYKLIDLGFESQQGKEIFSSRKITGKPNSSPHPSKNNTHFSAARRKYAVLPNKLQHTLPTQPLQSSSSVN